MTQQPALLDYLKGLIASPSISSVSPEFDQSNRGVIDLLGNWLEDLGFNVEIMPIPEQPNKANLIATLGSGSGGLVLSGHTDTVPYDEHRWQSDPFQLTERDERLYGLGTADMKSFLGLAMEAAKTYRARDLQQPLIILATADEESSMSGARALVAAQKPKASYAIVGEPTNMIPIRAHKGILMESIRIIGRSGHSSDPSLGNSALEAMHGLIGELLKFRDDLQQRYRDNAFKVAYPTLNLGHIHGGDNPNRICAECELHFDLRPTPALALDELRQAIDKIVGAFLSPKGLRYELKSLVHGTPPMHTGSQAHIVKLAESLTGHSATTAAYCTEGPYLNDLGMETIIMGPGQIDQAHQPDEYIALDQLQPTIRILRQFIQRCCITGS